MNAETRYFVRYSPVGVEYGPFTQEDRQDLEASARVRLYWRVVPESWGW